MVGGRFTFPFVTIESVDVSNPTTGQIIVVNDNNLPFSAGELYRLHTFFGAGLATSELIGWSLMLVKVTICPSKFGPDKAAYQRRSAHRCLELLDVSSWRLLAFGSR